VSIERLHITCWWADTLYFQVPRTHILCVTPRLEASFRMWPLCNPQRSINLAPQHQFQIEATERLLLRNAYPSPPWFQRLASHLLSYAAVPIAAHTSLEMRTASIHFVCPNSSMLQQPPAPDLPSPDDANPSSKSLVLEIESLLLAPLTSQHTFFSPTCTDSPRDALTTRLTALQLSGVSLQCLSVHHGDAGGTKEASHVLRRWAAEASLYRPESASLPLGWRSPGCAVQVHVAAHAIIAHADVHALRTLLCFSTALAEYGRFAAYREHRPLRAVKHDIRAWWRHAGESVLLHLRAIKPEVTLPVRCLPRLPAFVQVFKQGLENTARGALLLTLYPWRAVARHCPCRFPRKSVIVVRRTRCATWGRTSIIQGSCASL
jgi:hypothetical protein